MLNRIYNFLIWLGLTFIIIWSPIARGAVPKRIWSITPVLFVVATLVFIWLWRKNNNKQEKWNGGHRVTLGVPIALFIILAFTSFIFSIYKHDSFYALLRLLSYVGIYYLIISSSSKKLWGYIIGLVIVVGTGTSLYGLLQYFGALPHSWWDPKNFLSATYVNHNHFSGYLELVIPLSFGVLLSIKDKKLIIKPILALALTTMLAAFLFAQSRGAWASLLISLFAMNLILVKRKILNKKSVVILLLVIVFIFTFSYLKGGLVSKRIDSIMEAPAGEASIETRLDIWQGTLDMIKDNPWIGTGIGTFVWGFPLYRPIELANVSVHYAHNDYLHMAAEMGIFALPIMLLILVRIISSGLSKADPVVIGCAIGILSLSLHGLVDFNFHIPANMILVAVYAAIIMKEG